MPLINDMSRSAQNIDYFNKGKELVDKVFTHCGNYKTKDNDEVESKAIFLGYLSQVKTDCGGKAHYKLVGVLNGHLNNENIKSKKFCDSIRNIIIQQAEPIRIEDNRCYLKTFLIKKICPKAINVEKNSLCEAILFKVKNTSIDDKSIEKIEKIVNRDKSSMSNKNFQSTLLEAQVLAITCRNKNVYEKINQVLKKYTVIDNQNIKAVASNSGDSKKSNTQHDNSVSTKNELTEMATNNVGKAKRGESYNKKISISIDDIGRKIYGGNDGLKIKEEDSPLDAIKKKITKEKMSKKSLGIIKNKIDKMVSEKSHGFSEVELKNILYNIDLYKENPAVESLKSYVNIENYLQSVSPRNVSSEYTLDSFKQIVGDMHGCEIISKDRENHFKVFIQNVMNNIQTVNEVTNVCVELNTHIKKGRNDFLKARLADKLTDIVLNYATYRQYDIKKVAEAAEEVRELQSQPTRTKKIFARAKKWFSNVISRIGNFFVKLWANR